MIALENGPDDPKYSEQICGDVLFEIGWEDGFTCVLPKGHEPANRHVDRTWAQAEFGGTAMDYRGTATIGRKYRAAMVWGWVDG